MSAYIGIVHPDNNSGYGIAFPDLPGCFSAAEDLVELERNAVEAIELFLDGEDSEKFPASDMTAIRAGLDADDRDVMLMAIPFVRAGGQTVRVNFTLYAKARAEIDDAAKRRGMSRSAFLALAARNEISGRP